MWVPTIFGSAIFLINQLYLTPSSTVSSNFTVTKFEYISTQLYVILHYLGNFILPSSLSADPDIEIITPWYDKRILLGLLLILTLIFTAFKCAKNEKTRPISFGIAWFLLRSYPLLLFRCSKLRMIIGCFSPLWACLLPLDLQVLLL